MSLSEQGQGVLDQIFDAVADTESMMLEGFDAGQTGIPSTYQLRCRHNLSGTPLP